ncbi:hypothetical protein ACJX0J_006358 [Zea mays]
MHAAQIAIALNYISIAIVDDLQLFIPSKIAFEDIIPPIHAGLITIHFQKIHISEFPHLVEDEDYARP